MIAGAVAAEVEAAHGQTSREQGVLVRWDGAEGAGHLYSISTHGYVNFRPPDFVRGHGDHGGKGAKGAPQGPGTLVQLQGVDGGDASAAAAEALAAADTASGFTSAAYAIVPSATARVTE